MQYTSTPNSDNAEQIEGKPKSGSHVQNMQVFASSEFTLSVKFYNPTQKLYLT